MNFNVLVKKAYESSFIELLNLYEIECLGGDPNHKYFRGKIFDRVKFSVFVVELIRICKNKGYSINLDFMEGYTLILIN